MSWVDALPGAEIENGVVRSFAGATNEADVLANGTVISPLSQFGLIRFRGEETGAFLQGQLSSDVRQLENGLAQYSSYSTPKGRMLASFLIFRMGDDYLLQIPRDLQAAIQKRLSMFVLRSKTKADDASADIALIGVAGANAAAVVKAVAGDAPAADFTHHAWSDGVVLALPHGRFELAVVADQAAKVWQALQQAGATPVGEPAWRLSDVRAGIPWITASTQEEFVAQMANMELIGAVSFNKGCYPGQEIVARTQYLGKLKRRMYRVHVNADVVAGQDVFSPEMNGQASGKVMLAAPVGKGASEALVVVQTSSLEHGLHLGAVTGPQAQVLDLPYAVA
ncbi:CAF17-like 4Fe-4S cluster assembly/insertion protein YgfZ [Silvimonas iriomotensis]|uniref:Folate-binding protein n=1 Tax=Silvimonas iriomotensis TaxID=449662 RepID=A0ABQ2PFM1_9NEIS|nr:folate-binding protein YgfZ [Silvimonas iriomotensis]GGP23999.1 folate-binding protein [Silvimonas iriomotensis]